MTSLKSHSYLSHNDELCNQVPVCVRACVRACVRVFVFVFVNTHVCACVCVCVHARAHVCVWRGVEGFEFSKE